MDETKGSIDFEGYENQDLIVFSQTDPIFNDSINYMCKACEKDINDSDKAFRCEVCLEHYHLSCTQISAKLFSCWEDTPKNVHLYCNNCDAGAKILHHRMAALVREQENIRKDLREMKTAQQSMKAELIEYKIVTESKLEQIDQREVVKQLEDKVNTIENKIQNKTNYENIDVKKLLTDMEELTQNMKKQNSMIQKLAWENDNNEQYTRRENLRITGIREREGESTSQLVVQLAGRMGVQLQEADISVSHRLGTPRDASANAPRPIIVRFVRREMKDDILRHRKNLKDLPVDDLAHNESKIYVNDDMTHLKTTMRKILMKQPGVIRVGSINGKLLFTYKINNKEETTSIQDPMDLVKKLGWSLEKLQALGLCMDDEELPSEDQLMSQE